MEETREIRRLFNFLQGAVYGTILLDAAVFCLEGGSEVLQLFLDKLRMMPVYDHPWFSKAFTFVLMVFVSIGTRSRKTFELRIYQQILWPLLCGSALFFGSVYLLQLTGQPILEGITVMEAGYLILSLAGAVLMHTGMDNISKHVQSSWGKDRFNLDNESFRQSTRKIANPYSVNLPMRFYDRKKMHNGWLNITNPFRGNLLIGTPGSGKTYSVIIPFILQHLKKGFTMVLYDFKYPDLAGIACQEFLKNKRSRFSFHMLNLNEVEYSRRINPLKREYITSLSAATETAEALIEALRKSERAHGADQFFSQSAINFLAAIIYYFSKVKGGKYSTLPHVLAFVNYSYQEIFSALYQEPELHSLLAPFKSAYDQKAFDQLEGQIGTLRINLARLATKEAYWVFSGEDFSLRVSDPEHPSILVMANDPQTQQINSACFSVVINRLTRLLNQKGNLPCSVILDEAPTVYIHKVENLLATARSNRISVLLGLQELPQLRQQYGRDVAETICAVAGNILAGAVRNRDTLLWLEKLFGKVRQVRNGISVDRYRTSLSQNEYMDNLIPASRIANLSTGELVGQVASESRGYAHHMYHCQVRARYNLERYAQTELPRYYDFGKDREAVLTANMEKIRGEVREIIRTGASQQAPEK